MEHTRASQLLSGHLRILALRTEVRSGRACWPWHGEFDKDGYGRVRGREPGAESQIRLGAHRAAYLIHRGDIPPGLVLDHLCCHRWCVNPWHLEVVTQSENSLRMWRLKTTCKNGLHEMTPDNTFKTTKTNNSCRACRDAWQARARATA